jgi:uncharacterized NAD(P)/FAD-binding protein YdhS
MSREIDRYNLLTASRVHLRQAGEGYLSHLHFAAAVGTLMIAAGFACLLHALIPGVFTDKASRAVERLQVALADRPSGENLLAGSDADGLLTLLALSLVAALVPWIANADIAVASTLSLVALGLPAAALRAAATEDLEPDDEDLLDWAKLWLPKGQQEQPRLQHVAIVGAGFSGTMVAIHLARHPAIKVTLIDRRDAPAHGLAYATSEPNHLLNVRAAKMSAYPDDPGHFARWLAARKLGGPFDFAPRRSYGAYLEEQLSGGRADAGARLAVLTGAVRDVAFEGERASVMLDDGRQIEADTVVLANGNLASPAIAALSGLPDKLYCNDPWRDGLADGLGANDQVVIVGSGLTMIDTVVTLVDAGFAGRIVAVSRRGLLPRVHAEYPPPPFAVRHGPYRHLSQFLRSVRRRAEKIGWRAAIDELRPVTPDMWQALGDEGRGRFLRHLRPWWDVHRHRMAPAIADRIQALQAAGRFRVVAGTIVDAAARTGQAELRVRLRGTTYCEQFEAARVINCTGADGDIGRTIDSLLRSLLARQAIRPDRQRLGLDTGDHGEVLGLDGRPTAGLYALGPIARGRVFEATAVPELRVQAAALAATIAARVSATR